MPSAREAIEKLSRQLALRAEQDCVVPVASAATRPSRLCIGMATYDDFDGVWFTIQAIRLAHPEILEHTTFLIIDNHPEGIASEALRNLSDSIPDVRYIPFRGYRSTAVRDLIFRIADADIVMCIDSHVLIARGGIAALIDHFDHDPESVDLIQGPLLGENLSDLVATEFAPSWSHGMYGEWHLNPRVNEPNEGPFDIPMMGLGLFACRREAWPGFNPRIRGFGGEEGYIHEKFRQRGGRVLCLPALGWAHRFARPSGAPYSPQWEDRVRNYHLAWREIGWSTEPVEAHFRELLGSAQANEILARTQTRLASALTRLDAVLVLDQGTGWEPHLARLEAEDLQWRSVRIEAAADPDQPVAALARALTQALVCDYTYFAVIANAAGLPVGARERLEMALDDVDRAAPGPHILLDTGAATATIVVTLTADIAMEWFTSLTDESALDPTADPAQVLRVLCGLDAAAEADPDLPRHCDGIDVTEVDDGLVLYLPDLGTIHHLNGTAAVVFDLADGSQNSRQIATHVAELFGLSDPPINAVEHCIAELRKQDILV